MEDLFMKIFDWKKWIIAASCIISSASLAQQTAPVPSAEIIQTTTNNPSHNKSIDKKYTALKNLSDHIKWTSWVASNPTVDPEINIQFHGTRYVTAVRIDAGCAATNDTYRTFSRPKTIVVSSADRSIAANLADRRATQRILITPAMPTDEVTLKITKRYTGKHPAVCLSELHFEEITLPSHVSRETFARIQGLVNALKDANANTAIEELTVLGPTAIPMLMANLQDSHPIQSLQILETLQRVGSPIATPQLKTFAAKHINSAFTVAILDVLAATKDERTLPIITQILNDKNPAHTLAAAQSLKSFGPAASTILEQALKQPQSTAVTMALLNSLYHSHDDDIFAALQSHLNASNPSVRVAATRNLKHCDLGNPIVRQAMETCIADGHPSIRHAVSTALRGDSNTAVAIPLLAQLLHDPNTWVAREAIASISKSQGTAGARVLSQYLEQDSAPFGLMVIDALGTMKPRQSAHVLLELLRRGEVRFRQAARAAIAKQGRDGLRALLEAALDENSLRRDALETLNAYPDQALPLLMEVVRNRAHALPEFVVTALSATGSHNALHLLDTMWDNRIHRLAIVKGWSHFTAAQVQSRLTRVLSQETDAAIIRAAVQSAGRAHVRKAIPYMHDLLAQELVPTDLLIGMLGSLQDPTIEPYILKHFVTAPKSDRVAMLNTCHQLGTVECSRLLMNAVTDADGEIQRQAIHLLNTPMTPSAHVPSVARALP